MSSVTAGAVAPPKKRFLGLSGTQWIFASMFIGIFVGWMFPESDRANHGGWAATDLNVLSTVFIRMIKSVIGPLLFATLVVGIAGHSDDIKKVGRLALRSLIYFEIVTTLALLIGLLAVNIVRPGDGVNIADANVGALSTLATSSPSFAKMMEHLVPQSPVEAFATNNVLGIVFWTVMFSIGVILAPVGAKKFVVTLCESLSEVMFKFVGLVMVYAPIGIGAAIAVTVSKSGLEVLKSLSVLVLTLYGALIVFVLVVLVPVAIIARVPMRRFFTAVKEPFIIAFSSASSEAALPLALERMEQMGVPRRIVAFVLPTGYSFNLDGTTLYLALASVFVAQAAGMELTIGTQVAMMLTLMLTSKGVAAVPRASLVILMGTVGQFNLPAAGVALILGVDALMDMARTSINLVGNCLATVVMARWEGEFDTPGTDLPVADSLAGESLTVPSVKTPT